MVAGHAEPPVRLSRASKKTENIPGARGMGGMWGGYGSALPLGERGRAGTHHVLFSCICRAPRGLSGRPLFHVLCMLLSGIGV